MATALLHDGRGCLRDTPFSRTSRRRVAITRACCSAHRPFERAWQDLFKASRVAGISALASLSILAGPGECTAVLFTCSRQFASLSIMPLERQQLWTPAHCLRSVRFAEGWGICREVCWPCMPLRGAVGAAHGRGFRCTRFACAVGSSSRTPWRWSQWRTPKVLLHSSSCMCACGTQLSIRTPMRCMHAVCSGRHHDLHHRLQALPAGQAVQKLLHRAIPGGAVFCVF